MPFFWAAVVLAVVAGFGLGGALYALPATGQPVGSWWSAAARAHGHVQLVGWAGVMVLGVGLHFLPRLRGRALARPEHARTVLSLLVAGLVLRSLTEPMLAVSGAGTLALVLRAGLGLSGLLELGGVSLAIGLLALTLRGSPPAGSREGLRQALPFVGTAFVGFWLAALANLVAVVGVALGDNGSGTSFDRLVVLLALYVFLVPIAVGMGLRLFPLHFAARQPSLRLLRVGLLLLLFGVLLRVLGEAAGFPSVRAAGLLLLASALGLFLVGLRVFAPRRSVPGERQPWYADAAQWHGLTAAIWLALDALVLAFGALATLTGAAPGASVDVERHVLGAGFVTLLILGEGANLLPGFARRPLRRQGLVWATLGLGNLAAILRVGPLILSGMLPGSTAEVALASAGLAGLLAVAAFATNLGRSPGPSRTTVAGSPG
jgi:uncharacterized protein involved in response to NO